ncbi:hypothetical protein CLM_2491 [Clostridium botulinum A2 str. Kyoto]|uniref:Uncharacterized protein n=1 Tax=Clostridium botulinum (strain Kyoto / Type A2) TaxID=536232 RepID=C1FR58_CLOBJ|nr:hypothetical protein CLM_2491 [Clostridium botulinum A2 str. Kyoto]
MVDTINKQVNLKEGFNMSPLFWLGAGMIIATHIIEKF